MTQDGLLRKLEELVKDWQDREGGCLAIASNTGTDKMAYAKEAMERVAGIWKWCASEIEKLVSEAKADEEEL